MTTDDDIGTVRWFGESWGAPICDPRANIPAPIDQNCLACHLPIKSNDQGVGTLSYGIEHSVDGYVYYHLDCFLAEIGVPLPTPKGDGEFYGYR